jgi:hypothetical protein
MHSAFLNADEKSLSQEQQTALALSRINLRTLVKYKDSIKLLCSNNPEYCGYLDAMFDMYSSLQMKTFDVNNEVQVKDILDLLQKAEHAFAVLSNELRTKITNYYYTRGKDLFAVREF